MQNILLNREVTESLTGLTLDKAREMATEALDPSVVQEMIKNKLVGRYFVVVGARIGQFILVDSIKQDVKPLDENIENINRLLASPLPIAQEA